MDTCVQRAQGVNDAGDAGDAGEMNLTPAEKTASSQYKTGRCRTACAVGQRWLK